MQFDGAALSLLREVAEDWEANGPLSVLREVTRRVWFKDVDRHEPKLGDDAMTLGVLASRNICNLVVEELRDAPGVVARDLRTLEIGFAGRVLHVSKAPPQGPDWDVSRVDWSASDVRDDAARVNSAAYQPVEGTLFEALGPLPGQSVDAVRLRNLHYVWLGDPDGTTREWLGFPRLEPPFWFAVIELGEGRDHRGQDGEPLGPRSPQGPPPSFDELGEPAVPLSRRRRRSETGSRYDERGA